MNPLLSSSDVNPYLQIGGEDVHEASSQPPGTAASVPGSPGLLVPFAALLIP